MHFDCTLLNILFAFRIKYRELIVSYAALYASAYSPADKLFSKCVQ